GGSTLQTLEALGITEIRMRDALLRSAGAGDLLSESISIANSAWDENLALTEEAEQRYSTTESRIMLARNAVNDLAISIGESLTPMVGGAADFVADLAAALSDLPAPVQATLAGIGGLTTAVGLAGGAFLLALPRIAETRAALPEPASQGRTVRPSLSRLASFMTGPWGIALAAGAVALYGVARAAGELSKAINEVEAALASGDLEQGVQALVDEFAALGQPGDLGTEIGRFF